MYTLCCTVQFLGFVLFLESIAGVANSVTTTRSVSNFHSTLSLSMILQVMLAQNYLGYNQLKSSYYDMM